MISKIRLDLNPQKLLFEILLLKHFYPEKLNNQCLLITKKIPLH